MGKIDKELLRNGSGYCDPTAYRAIKNIEDGIDDRNKERARFFRLLDTIFYICEMAGFEIEGRIVLKDKKTGKVWK